MTLDEDFKELIQKCNLFTPCLWKTYFFWNYFSLQKLFSTQWKWMVTKVQVRQDFYWIKTLHSVCSSQNYHIASEDLIVRWTTFIMLLWEFLVLFGAWQPLVSIQFHCREIEMIWRNSANLLLLCSTEESKSYRFRVNIRKERLMLRKKVHRCPTLLRRRPPLWCSGVLLSEDGFTFSLLLLESLSFIMSYCRQNKAITAAETREDMVTWSCCNSTKLWRDRLIDRVAEASNSKTVTE